MKLTLTKHFNLDDLSFDYIVSEARRCSAYDGLTIEIEMPKTDPKYRQVFSQLMTRLSDISKVRLIQIDKIQDMTLLAPVENEPESEQTV